MKGLRTLVPAVAAACALLAAGAALYLILSPAPPPKEDELQSTLRMLDAALSAGALPAARNILDGIRILPSAENDLLRILKRAFEASTASGDYGITSRLALRAFLA